MSVGAVVIQGRIPEVESFPTLVLRPSGDLRTPHGWDHSKVPVAFRGAMWQLLAANKGEEPGGCDRNGITVPQRVLPMIETSQ